jgi:hypothetical protein
VNPSLQTYYFWIIDSIISPLPEQHNAGSKTQMQPKPDQRTISIALVSAPASSSSRTQSAWPLRAAQISAVRPTCERNVSRRIRCPVAINDARGMQTNAKHGHRLGTRLTNKNKTARGTKQFDKETESMHNQGEPFDKIKYYGKLTTG